jgi:hypothetical protein
MLQFTLLSLMVIYDKNADAFTYHFRRCPQTLLIYQRWCWSFRARNPIHLSSRISASYQSTLTWNKTETSFRNLEHDSNCESGTRQGAHSLYFHGSDIIFVLSRLQECMQGLKCYLDKIQSKLSKQFSMYGNTFFNLKEMASSFQN